MPAAWNDHFRPPNMRPKHENPMVFITSQWQYDKDTPSIIYAGVRLAIFITFFVIWILTITMETPAGRLRWPVYLTNWGLTLCLLQSFMACVLVIGAVADDFMRGKYFWKYKIARLYPIYWVLNVMATAVAFTITLIYWTLIYSAEGAYWSNMNFMVHGFNTILMLVDFWAVSHPVQLLHCVYPVIVAFSYTIMTAIFYMAGGTTKTGSKYIYPILKWDEPGSTIGYCIGVIILMVIIHMLTYFMYKLKVKISPPILSLLREKLFKCCDSPYYV